MKVSDLPPDTPDFVKSHVHAMCELAAGRVIDDSLVLVPWPEGSERYDRLVGTPPGFRTAWYRLSLEGPVPRKRHHRRPTPGDGWTLDSLGGVS